MAKKTKLQKALEAYNKKLEYQRKYQQEKYEKLTVAIKKEDIISFITKQGYNPEDKKLYEMVKKYLVMLKLKDELKKDGFIK